MMKKHGLLLLTALSAVTFLAGCGEQNTTAEIAVVTDVGSLKDGGFNEGTWNGAKEYAEANGKTVQYYQPNGGANATDADRVDAMNLAIENGAKVIVAPGYLQQKAMETVAKANPEVKFVFVDGWNFGLNNVTAISYKEQEAGYMAGYAAYMEGYRQLGGTFGGGGTNPACNRFAYGYVQGINAAAVTLAKTDAAAATDATVKMSFKYGSSFSASTDLQTQMSGWYQGGTEVIFACGGSMIQSVISASNAYKDAKIIGVDTDQSGLSEKVITSAMKGLVPSVKKILGEYYGGEWDSKLADKTSNLGAADDATGLPTGSSWRFKKFTESQYNTLFNNIKNGDVVILDTITAADKAITWTAIDALLTKITINFEA